MIIVLLIVLLLFGGFGYSRRDDWGLAPVGGIGTILVILLILYLLGYMR